LVSGIAHVGWDIIFVSHDYQPVDMLVFIAESTTGDQTSGNDDITTILRPLIYPTLLEVSKKSVAVDFQ
jgi:hypothetical protein